ncbi:MAG TPA: hypothetical protein VGP94_12975, partial [Tepidisphaeraceae bacterium]|nr:hypothetical protein [Tepidisphaeraceae bacterium]
MKRATSLACLLIFTLTSTKTFASDPIGIYALIDRVVLEPSDSQPERIQIHGAFCFAMRQFGDDYSPPVRGYLYYQLPADKPDLAVAKAEWADMKKIAGTGQIIAFGSRYKHFGVLRRGAGPAVLREVNEKDVTALLAKLDDQDQSNRDAATDDLKRLGAAAEPKLRSALASTSTSAEAKNRIERVLADLQPDPYPIGFGLNRVRANQNSGNVGKLRIFPAAFSPADGTLVDAGSIKLIAANIAAADSKPRYFFEIENLAGEKESSGAVEQGQKQTEWSPKIQLKSGEKYTWRVWVDDGKTRGPIADATFVARASRP